MSRTVEILKRLIAVPTPNPGGDERALASLLADELRARGAARVELLEAVRAHGGAPAFSAFASWGTPRLLVNVHLDTVPPNAGWTGHPFEARVSGGRVTGLGAADTKGAIAALLAALEEARPEHLAVLFSGDEEHGGGCMRAFLQSEHARGLTQAVVCEPTGCRPGIRHRGILAVEATAEGTGGHSSHADRMPAPLADLARLAVAWDDWGKARRDEGPAGFEGMCANVARLDGGVAFNVVPARASLAFSCRPPPGDDVQRVLGELEGLAQAVLPSARLEAQVKGPSFATREPAAFRPWLGEAMDRPVDLPFWTEAALLSEAGIDAVVFGPGDIAQAHAPDEWVAVEQLELAQKTFVRLLQAAGARRGAG